MATCGHKTVTGKGNFEMESLLNFYPAERRIPLTVRRWGKQTAWERFVSKLQLDEATGCWLWQGSCSRFGYGKFTVGHVTVSAHRYAYSALIGDIQIGMTCDHTCRTPSCVNPHHIDIVTLRVNLLRADTFQARNAAKTHCPAGHPYNTDNTLYRKDGSRVCRECGRLRSQRQRMTRRLKTETGHT